MASGKNDESRRAAFERAQARVDRDNEPESYKPQHEYCLTIKDRIVLRWQPDACRDVKAGQVSMLAARNWTALKDGLVALRVRPDPKDAGSNLDAMFAPDGRAIVGFVSVLPVADAMLSEICRAVSQLIDRGIIRHETCADKDHALLPSVALAAIEPETRAPIVHHHAAILTELPVPDFGE